MALLKCVLSRDPIIGLLGEVIHECCFVLSEQHFINFLCLCNIAGKQSIFLVQRLGASLVCLFQILSEDCLSSVPKWFGFREKEVTSLPSYVPRNFLVGL